MFVRDICTRDVKTCGPDHDLARCASILWENDCGVVPVVEHGHKLVGILTDRDMCMALGTRDVPASQLRASDVMSRQVRTCRMQDDAHTALKIMAQHKIRRLPVVEANDTLVGLLSINDVILAAADQPEVMPDVMATLRSIGEHYGKPEPAAAGRRSR
ncbi:MAG: CBS domain-containing protein [Planctomycetes bacterium]|nr:CBS domain-containing protein [Planctomycetota bacterium]